MRRRSPRSGGSSTPVRCPACLLDHPIRRESFAKRAGLATNPMGRKLFEVREAKQSNLCVAADVGTTKELLELANEVYMPLVLVYLRCLSTIC